MVVSGPDMRRLAQPAYQQQNWRAGTQQQTSARFQPQQQHFQRHQPRVSAGDLT